MMRISGPSEGRLDACQHAWFELHSFLCAPLCVLCVKAPSQKRIPRYPLSMPQTATLTVKSGVLLPIRGFAATKAGRISSVLQAERGAGIAEKD
jgi:hypothetical protein